MLFAIPTSEPEMTTYDDEGEYFKSIKLRFYNTDNYVFIIMNARKI